MNTLKFEIGDLFSTKIDYNFLEDCPFNLFITKSTNLLAAAVELNASFYKIYAVNLSEGRGENRGIISFPESLISQELLPDTPFECRVSIFDNRVRRYKFTGCQVLKKTETDIILSYSGLQLSWNN